MKKAIIILCICILLSSCNTPKIDDNKNTDDNTTVSESLNTGDTSPDTEDSQKFTSELIRTGETYEPEALETLKEEASNWQSITAGIGGFADVVVIEPSDGSEQQVYISVDYKATYEKLQIQPSDEAKAQIAGASTGAGSGEIVIAYKMEKGDSEWIEFFLFAMDMNNGQWQNMAEVQDNSIDDFNEIFPDEKRFKYN